MEALEFTIREFPLTKMNRVLSALLSRVAEWAPGGSSVRPRLQRWRGVQIGDKVWIGLFVHIDPRCHTGPPIG